MIKLQWEENLQSLDFYWKKFRASFGGGQETFICVDDENINIFKWILSKRTNIKNIKLGIKIFTIDVLLSIVKLCQKLQTIHFKGLDFI